MNSDDAISVLELLNNANIDLSYDVICKMSEDQRALYHEKLEVFLKYNSLKSTDVSVATNLNRLKGKSLEDLAAYLLKISGDLFVVDQNLRTSTNEIDQVFKPTQKAKVLIASGIINKHYELFLGECKNYNKSVDVTFVGKFCSLLLTTQIKFGIMFSYHGISGKGWNNGSGLVRKFYLHKEREEDRYCIIDFSKEDFIAIDEGKNFLQIIDDKLLALRIDTDYKKDLSKHPAEETISYKNA
jgi:hypothetical protein